MLSALAYRGHAPPFAVQAFGFEGGSPLPSSWDPRDRPHSSRRRAADALGAKIEDWCGYGDLVCCQVRHSTGWIFSGTPKSTLIHSSSLVCRQYLSEGITQSHLAKSMQVYLGASPMAISATEIFRHHPECFEPATAKCFKRDMTLSLCQDCISRGRPPNPLRSTVSMAVR